MAQIRLGSLAYAGFARKGRFRVLAAPCACRLVAFKLSPFPGPAPGRSSPMNTNTWIKNDYDTLTTRPNRDAQYYLLRHLRRRGLLHVDGGGRLARFGRISALKRVCPRTVIEGRLDRIFVAEYEHYVWRVRPLCVYCG